MALDGIALRCITNELATRLTNGRLYKIAQPETDELLFTIKNNKEQFRLLISANASLPLIYLTEENKLSPMTAPGFCMLLRKHLNNGRITGISQPGLERIIDFEIEHLNEMGDLCKKHLIVELMGKHSNIIFTDDENRIIDSIKHIPASVSSVREVLPGRSYFIPETIDKTNPLEADYNTFSEYVYSKPYALSKAIYTSLTGISPIVAENICHKASIDSDVPANTLNENERLHLYNMFSLMADDIKNGQFNPGIYYNNEEPVEFSALPLDMLSSYSFSPYSSMSEVLYAYYAKKNTISRVRQKSSDLRRVVSTTLERDYKKLDLQLKQLKDTEKREKYRIFGELINTYGYNISEGSNSFTAFNYYTNEEVSIPLDPTLLPKENAVKYFDRYNKLKRTFEALTELTEETKKEIAYLESVSNALDIALYEEDLTDLKEELIESGFIKRKAKKEKARVKSAPFHYISSDGFHIYVGKNNLQNEELTFKLANGNDIWFHAKDMAGSHVILKTENKEIPDRAYEEAAALAAYYSKSRNQEKVEVDYTERKNIKKPPASNPGFVIYHKNYSMNIKPENKLSEYNDEL